MKVKKWFGVTEKGAQRIFSLHKTVTEANDEYHPSFYAVKPMIVISASAWEAEQKRVAALEKDAARFNWIASYFVSDDTRYDAALIAGQTIDEIRDVIDAAIEKGGA